MVVRVIKRDMEKENEMVQVMFMRHSVGSTRDRL